MPIKMKMFIIQNNQPSNQLINFNALKTSIPYTTTSSALNSPFIARIHNAKAGCSSCGRK
jgi:hypothetical protein